VGVLSKRIDEVNNVLATITESMQSIPSKEELHQHQGSMEEQFAKVEENNSGLTMAME
jgi:hypothetical protein